ncbi:hypothetical protein [Neorhizobium sp. JUb45]|uniref:hypothetical protein n=1 Tax=Neorhizobium sp. JUb45 TaxID=2485113 RepID=UPI001052503C|nr:hypothetical protein [Neorhizobium sp. JUb45]TCR07221.1 hypothetical protein EDF70_1011192 [Neorhizobium sp. JUb45]
MSQCDCETFDAGDWVECQLDTDLFGIVVGDADFGRIVSVQLAGSLEIRPFFAVTLRHVAPKEPPAVENDDTNVIHVDFTKPRALDANTTTEGAA